MKRMSSILASESDDDDFDISKIKKKYKHPKTEDVKKQSTNSDKKEKKSKVLSKNQMTLESAFANVEPIKPSNKSKIDSYFTKTDKSSMKQALTPDEFFDRSRKEKTLKKTETDINQNIETTKKKFVVETSPTKKEKKEELIVKESPITPVKSTGNIASPSKAVVTPVNSTGNIASPSKAVVTPVKSTDTIVSPPKSASKKAFHSYLNRSGPSAIGSKEIPKGAPNCLAGLTFVITGVLDSIERDDAQMLIQNHGGKVTKALSGRTNYLVVGVEPGEGKLEKANKLHTKQINEDELFDLIRKSNGKPINSVPTSAKKSEQTQNKVSEVKSTKPQSKPTTATAAVTDHIEIPSTSKVLPKFVKESQKTEIKSVSLSAKPIINKPDMETAPTIVKQSTNYSNATVPTLFVDKYRPTTLKQIIGQHGDRSPANKLFAWLSNWEKNYQLGFKKSNDDGENFRGALLSGSPGIGKTTTAHVVCRQLGYTIREYNASSSRSKKDLVEVAALSKESFNSRCWNKDLKYCIIMDEIDGMSGVEDRGGITELISIIKSTQCPIICICNDRQSMKLRSIGNYVYDLRYRQLTLEQIKGAVKSVSFKERIAIPDECLNEIISASNFDMRQVFNNLQMWSAGSLEAEQLRTDARQGHKEFKLGPFDVVKRVFSHESVSTISDKLDLFFEDYNLGGLFVQENYLNVAPTRGRQGMSKVLELMSLTADSIATSDIVSRKLRSSNNWSLLTTQGIFASVLPGEYFHGHIKARIQFPSWLGRFSKQNRTARVLSSLCNHLRLSTHGGASSPTVLALDYGRVLLRRLISPLRQGDIETTLNILNELNLTREDLDLLVESTGWSHRGPYQSLADVSSQVKSALTRAYNRAKFKLPYDNLTSSVKKGRSGDGGLLVDDIDGEELLKDEEEEDEEEEKPIIAAKISSKKSNTKSTAADSNVVTKKPSKRKNEPKKEPKASGAAKRTKKQ